MTECKCEVHTNDSYVIGKIVLILCPKEFIRRTSIEMLRYVK